MASGQRSCQFSTRLPKSLLVCAYANSRRGRRPTRELRYSSLAGRSFRQRLAQWCAVANRRPYPCPDNKTPWVTVKSALGIKTVWGNAEPSAQPITAGVVKGHAAAVGCRTRKPD